MAVWIVDLGYVHGIGREQGCFRLNLTKGRSLIRQRLGECRAYIFAGKPDLRAENRLPGFYAKMAHEGFEVCLYEMEHGRQRQVDVAIACRAVLSAISGEDVVITTGDVDFVPAFSMITQELGRKLVLFSYEAGVHEQLTTLASEHWTFESVRKIVELHGPTQPRRRPVRGG